MKVMPPAAVWAAVFTDELVRAGVTQAVVAPGSRSTPLVLAMAAHPGIETLSLLDERGAGFFALGMGLASGFPAVLICTSGTAAANFYPAVIEAAQAQVPMLVLTADRPHELRGTGANQTIDQLRLYGAYPRWFQDMPLPEDQPSRATLRFLRTTADRAVAACMRPVPGPVHINFPFRKPFEPSPGTSFPFDLEAPVNHNPRPQVAFKNVQAGPTKLGFDLPRRTLIVAGPRCPGKGFPETLAAFSRKTGFPIVADGLSGLRFGSWVADGVVLHPRACRAAQMPELVLQFGVVPTSQTLVEFLSNLNSGTHRISIQPSGTWHDDAHTISELITADPEDFCHSLYRECGENIVDATWRANLENAEVAYWHSINRVRAEGWFEGLILPEVVDSLVEDSVLFVANSNPVRHLEEFVQPVSKKLHVFANRGASGIDGNLSTAFGLAEGLHKRVVAVCGDLALYHDLNGLLALRRLTLPAVIVLINNDGGGIFRRLPVASHNPAFTDLFLTPHGLDFEPAARLFGIGYRAVGDEKEIRAALGVALTSESSTLIEVKTDSKHHEMSRRQVLAYFENYLRKGEVIHE